MSPDVYSYQEAADLLGVDHHYIRMLTSRGRFTISHREEVRPNVLKVFLNAAPVDAYHMENRVMETRRVRLTMDQWRLFDRWVISVKRNDG